MGRGVFWDERVHTGLLKGEVVRKASWRHRGEDVVVLLLSEFQAHKAGVVPVSWRESVEGQWALSDDGWVVRCRRVLRRLIKGRWWDYYDYGVGMVWSFADEYRVAPFLESGLFRGSKPDGIRHPGREGDANGLGGDLADRRYRAAAQLAAAAMVVGIGLTGEVLWQMGRILEEGDVANERPKALTAQGEGGWHRTEPWRRARRYLKNSARLKGMIRHALRQHLTDLGLTDSAALEYFSELVEDSRDKEYAKVSERLKVFQKMQEMLGMDADGGAASGGQTYLEEGVNWHLLNEQVQEAKARAEISGGEEGGLMHQKGMDKDLEGVLPTPVRSDSAELYKKKHQGKSAEQVVREDDLLAGKTRSDLLAGKTRSGSA